jgi:hypothetical protein
MYERDEKRSILLPLKALKMEGNNRMPDFVGNVDQCKYFVIDLDHYRFLLLMW